MNIISLHELIVLNNELYTGDYFHTTVKINDSVKIFPFVKGNMSFLPSRFQTKYYNKHRVQTAIYIIKEFTTGKIYIGSTNKIYRRIEKHKYFINIKKHTNKNINELLVNTNIKHYDIIIIFTPNREEAYLIEQYLINHYKNSGLLLNIADDVRLPMLGKKISEEHKRKIGLAQKGKKISEEVLLKRSYSLRNSLKLKEHHKRLSIINRKKIMVDGVIYNSLKEASTLSPYTKKMLQNRLLKEKSGIYYLDKE